MLTIGDVVWVGSDLDYVRKLGEWDWWQFPRGRDVLHAATVDPDPAYETAGEGTTACGRSGWLMIPGVFTRMGARRCVRCCKATGYPTGKGSPKNDKRCRPLVEARLRVNRIADPAKPLFDLGQRHPQVQHAPAERF